MVEDFNAFIVSYSIFIMVYCYAIFSYPIMSDVDLFISIFSTAIVFVVPIIGFFLFNKKKLKVVNVSKDKNMKKVV